MQGKLTPRKYLVLVHLSCSTVVSISIMSASHNNVEFLLYLHGNIPEKWPKITTNPQRKLIMSWSSTPLQTTTAATTSPSSKGIARLPAHCLKTLKACMTVSAMNRQHTVAIFCYYPKLSEFNAKSGYFLVFKWPTILTKGPVLKSVSSKL